MKRAQITHQIKHPKALACAVAAALSLATLPLQSQAADPEVEKLFKEGLYLRETGQTYSAIELLETALKAQPTLQRVRLELAVAYYRTLNFARAKAEAQQVLDDPKTPENVKLAVSAFLAQIKKDEETYFGKKHKLEPFVSLGLIYDSNVNTGPSSELLPGGLVLTPGSLKKDDAGAVLQAGIGHTYQSPVPMRIGETATRFLWKSQGKLYHRGYFDLNEYNLTVATVATGPAWIAPNKWRANINLQFDNLWLDNDELAQFYSLAPSFTKQVRDGEFTLDALLLHKDFNRAVDAGRSSDYVAGGVSYGRILRNGKAAVQAGVRLFNENADESMHSNDGYEASLYGGVLAWPHGNVYARYNYKRSWFEGLVPLFGVARKEDEHRYEIGFGHDFKEGRLAGWTLNGSWQHTDNEANVSIYDYQRNLVSLSLNRSF